MRGEEPRGGPTQPCCEGCARVDWHSYRLEGDGDGIEFLTEVGHLFDGDTTTTTVVLTLAASPTST